MSNQYLIIDPGENSSEWIMEICKKKPLGILNTHGHYDHVFDNKKLNETLKVPIYIHEEDADLLSNGLFLVGLQKSIPNVCFQDGDKYTLGPFSFKCIHLPGHSHGTTVLDFGMSIFSGDFVMKNTVGRYNLPTSDKDKMKASLVKFIEIYSSKYSGNDIVIYPGHGESFNISKSFDVVNKWLNFF